MDAEREEVVCSVCGGVGANSYESRGDGTERWFHYSRTYCIQYLQSRVTELEKRIEAGKWRTISDTPGIDMEVKMIVSGYYRTDTDEFYDGETGAWAHPLGWQPA